MKSYTFTQISAREYPTVQLLDNPYIWGGVQLAINVSEKPYSSDLWMAMQAHGISWLSCPVSEEPGAKWLDALGTALRAMIAAHLSGMKMVVHCDGGNNRSRSFVEALYFVLNGEHLADEYKGEYNHLIYNSRQGHLPPLPELENYLNSWRTNLEVIQGK